MLRFSSRCFILLLVPGLLLLPARGRAGVTVDLGELALDLGPGGRGKLQFVVANTGSQPSAIKIFPSDWQQSVEGAVDAVAPGPHPPADSATRWLSVSPQAFLLAAGEKKPVLIAIATPDEPMTLKEYRSMVFVETAETRLGGEAHDGRRLDVRVIERIGVKIFLRNPGKPTALACDLTRLSETTLEGQRGLTIEAANRGNVHLVSEDGRIQIRDLEGRTVEKIKAPPFSILPGATRRIFCPFPRETAAMLQTGKRYEALAVIDYGGSDLVAGELQFTY